MANQQTSKPAAPAQGSSVLVASGTNWATALLTLLNAPPTPANYQFLNQWTLREHGNLSMFANNPFFTTAGGAGTVGPVKSGTYPLIPDSAFGGGRNTAGVPAYPSLAVGVWINALHIATGYPAIAAALRSGNPAASAGNPDFQSQLKKWSGGGYDGFASISAPSGPAGPAIGAPITNPAGGSSSSSSGEGFLDGVAGSVGGALSGVGGDINGALRHVPGVAQAEGVAGFIGKLTDPSYILRALQIVAGAGMVAIGVTLLARQVALANDLPDPVKAAPGVAAAAAIE